MKTLYGLWLWSPEFLLTMFSAIVVSFYVGIPKWRAEQAQKMARRLETRLALQKFLGQMKIELKLENHAENKESIAEKLRTIQSKNLSASQAKQQQPQRELSPALS